MDILTHTLSGTAVASAIAPFLTERNGSRLQLVLLGALAGALPDLDALSMWSGFDGTFGKWFGLDISGREIFSSKRWYAHHAFTHSLLASVLFPGIVLLFVSLVKRSKPGRKSVFIALMFTASYNSHLLGDLPTPGGSWQGIAYFFPSDEYSGGFGLTWWWTNYDIFLIVLFCTLINIASFFIVKLKPMFVAVSLTVATILCIVQLNRRDFDFNSSEYSSTQKREHMDKLQREFLGETVYNWMVKFDASLPVHF